MERGLDCLRPGEGGIVTRVDPALADALARLGLIPGTTLRCLRRCPLGDPAVYRFRATDLALRGRDAAKIRVSSVEAADAPRDDSPGREDGNDP